MTRFLEQSPYEIGKPVRTYLEQPHSSVLCCSLSFASHREDLFFGSGVKNFFTRLQQVNF